MARAAARSPTVRAAWRRAGLPQREPEWLDRWARIGIYDRLRDLFVRSPWIIKFVLFVAVVQLVISFASADVQPFIYTQF